MKTERTKEAKRKALVPQETDLQRQLIDSNIKLTKAIKDLISNLNALNNIIYLLKPGNLEDTERLIFEPMRTEYEEDVELLSEELKKKRKEVETIKDKLRDISIIKIQIENSSKPIQNSFVVSTTRGPVDLEHLDERSIKTRMLVLKRSFRKLQNNYANKLYFHDASIISCYEFIQECKMLADESEIFSNFKRIHNFQTRFTFEPRIISKSCENIKNEIIKSIMKRSRREIRQYESLIASNQESQKKNLRQSLNNKDMSKLHDSIEVAPSNFYQTTLEENSLDQNEITELDEEVSDFMSPTECPNMNQDGKPNQFGSHASFENILEVPPTLNLPPIIKPEPRKVDVTNQVVEIKGIRTFSQQFKNNVLTQSEEEIS